MQVTNEVFPDPSAMASFFAALFDFSFAPFFSDHIGFGRMDKVTDAAWYEIPRPVTAVPQREGGQSGVDLDHV
jgi:hypothetical protein